MSTPSADESDAPVEAVTDAEQVAADVRAKLDAGHQDPEDVRAAAHFRWPDHTRTIDETVDAGLAGRPVAVVHDQEHGRDALVDPHLTGLEADENGVLAPGSVHPGR